LRLAILTFAFLTSIPGAVLVCTQQLELTTLKDEVRPVIAQSSPSPTPVIQQRRDENDVIRVDTNLISIPATVMDRDGRYITDLRKEDFQIFEDGVEQQVVLFEPVEQPFTILFLLDVSGSMGYRMDELAHAANAFISQLRPDDWLTAISFADFPWVLFHSTRISDLGKGIKIQQRRDQTTTMVYDAVDDALNRTRKIKGRKAIVLFSDGAGGGIFASAKGNLHKAEEQDALIYTVQFALPTEPPRHVDRKYYVGRIGQINAYMKDLAQKTGGRHYKIEQISDLETTFGLVADELRRQYSLGYYPKKRLEAGQQRQIKVKVRLPNLVVRARDSYTVDKDHLKGK